MKTGNYPMGLLICRSQVTGTLNDMVEYGARSQTENKVEKKQIHA